MKGFQVAGMIAVRFFLCIGCIAADGAVSGLSALPGDRRDLLVHMERAERSGRPEAWDRLFKDGLSAVPGWEISGLRAEFEARFGRWIGREWAAGAPGARAGEFLREIDRTSLAYIMETDAEGRVLRDEKGDPVFKGMENFSGDEAERRSRLEAKMEELLTAWDREAAAESQELLSMFTGSLKEIAARRLAATVEEHRRGVRGEFERLTRQGQSLFLAARLKDSFSLRKKSEEKNAEETARRLIGDTGHALAEARNMLLAGMPSGGDGEPEKIILSPETWQEDFKREFERGIGEWNRAEERFFAERIRWETEAQREYVSAEAAWDSAFSEFANARGEWMAGMQNLLDKGRLAWEKSERDFLSDYGRVMTDLAAASAVELEKLREETAGYLEVYRRSLSPAETAEENGALLEAEILRLSERKTVLDGEIAYYDASVMEHQDRINALILDTFDVWKWETYQEADSSYTEETATQEGRKLLQYFGISLADYLAMTEESRGALIAEYNETKRHAEAIGEIGNATAGIRENEIAPRLSEREAIVERLVPELAADLAYWTGPGGIRDRFEASRIEAAEALLALEAEIRSYGEGSIRADSLDREIERIRAELALKTGQVEIARAVLDYARDTSSNRPTEAQTEAALRAAESAFAEAEAEYRLCLDALDHHIIGALETARENTGTAKSFLSSAAEDLEAARRAYEEALSVYRSNDTAVLRAVIEGYDEELARYYGSGPGSRGEGWEKYAAAWEGLARAELAARARETAMDIEGESDFDDFPDLPTLRAQAETLTGGPREEADILVYRSERILEALRGEPLSAAEGEEFLAGLREFLSRKEDEYRLALVRLEEESLPVDGEAAAVLETERRSLREAEVLLRVWEDYGRSSPVLAAMYRARDAEVVRALLAGADLTCREGVLIFSRALAAPDNLPSYLTEALGRWVSVKARSLGLSLTAPEIPGPEADYGGLYLLVTDGAFSTLEKAGALERAGIPGVGPFLLAAASEYLDWRRSAAGTAGEDDALYLSEALALAGLDPDAVSLVEVLAFHPDLDGEDALSRTVEEYLHRAAGEIAALIAREGAEKRSAAWLAGTAAFTSPGAGLLTDVSAYRAIAEGALEIFSRGNPLPAATAEDVKRLKYLVLAGERNVLRLAAAKKTMESDLAVLQAGREAYKTGVLEGKRTAMNEAGEKLADARRLYDRALDIFAEASEVYTVLKTATDGARAAYAERRDALRKAEDIRDYAVGGYTPAGRTPEAVLDARTAEAERIRSVLGMLESVKTAGELPFPERMDGKYGEAKEMEKIRQDALQYLALAEEEISREAAEIRKNILTAASDMGDAVSKIFTLGRTGEDGTREGLFFSVEADNTGGTLTDFRYADESAFAAAVSSYLSGDKEETARRLSADAALWIAALYAYGSEMAEDLLRDFGLAYYYDAVVQDDLLIEGAPGVSAGLFGNQSWQKLIDDYTGLGPYTAAVTDADGEIIGYETRYSEESWTVEDYLANKTGAVYETVQADINLYRLYSFYKMMIAANNLAGGTAYIGKDLGDLVFDHVDSLARRKQNRYLTWWRVWTHAEGRRVRALRQDIEDARETGAAERRTITEALGAFAAADSARTENLARLGGLLGGGALTAEGFLLVLAEKTGRTPSAELTRITEVLLPGLNEAKRDNALTILAAVKDGTRLRAENSRLAAETAAGRLQAERLAVYREYRELVEGGSFDDEAARRLIEDLYKNPSFTPEDGYDYSLLIGKSIRADTRGGFGEKLAAVGLCIEDLLKGRLDAAGEADRERLLGELRALQDRRGEWEHQIRDLLETGAAEWQAGAIRLYGMRKRWQEEYAAEYGEKNRLWDMKYVLFAGNRDAWIKAGAEYAVTAGAEGMAKEVGLDKDRLLSEVERVRIPDMGLGSPDLRREVARALDGKTMENLLAQAAGLTSRAEDEKPLVAAYVPAARNGTAALRHAEDFARGIGDEIYRKAALAAAVEMAKAVEETEKGIADTIASANRGVEKNLSDTLRSAGYQRSGRIFSRRAVIDETLLGGIERETQEIEGFRYFVAPEFRHGADLSREGLEGKSGDYIGGLIRLAQKNLSKYLELVFGRDRNKKKDWTWEGAAGVEDLFEDARLAYEASAGYGRMKDGEYENRADGLFNWHVGYLPVMDPKNAEKVKEAGYGELGRIMALYLRNEARLGRGLAGFDVAWYSKKLWDDDKDNDGKPDGMFGAPTVRSLTNIAVSIAATATGNVWLAAAVNMMDDAAFTMMDAAGGRTSLGEGMLSLGKQAGVGAAGLGIGVGMGILGESLGAYGGDMLGKTLLKGTELFAVNTAAGAINAARAGKNGLTFNEAVFQNTLIGKAALASYAGGMAGTFLEGGLEGLGRGDVDKVKSFAGFSGSLVQAGVQYSLSGEAKVNAANFAMFGMDYRGRTLSGGLLDITLGGRGPLFEIGNSGIDMSLGRIASAINGMGTWGKNIRIELADRFGDKDFAEGYSGVRSTGTAMRSLYSFGDETGQTLLEDLLSGGKTLRVGYTGGRGETAGKDVHLAGLGNNRDLNSRLAAGTVLQHEAYRDGVHVGETQADGTVETRKSNFEELKEASIARLHMAAGIDGDYTGFLSGNKDLLFETFLYAKALQSGQDGLFLDYLAETYRNGEDFYFPEVSTKGEYQNNAEYRRYPLLAAKTEEAVRAVNAERMEKAVDAYIKHLAKENAHPGDLEDIVLPPGVTRERLAEEIKNDPELQKRFDYRPLKYESLASDGCMMMAAMYGAEALSGLDLSAPGTNRMLKEAGLYANDSDLSSRLLGRVMELLTKGEYRFDLLDLGGPSPNVELLKALSDSPDSYLAHLRIKREGGGAAYHSEMLSSLDWNVYYLPGSDPGVRGVRTANPWQGNGYTGRTYRTMDEIARWDIYKAEPTWRYYFNRRSDWGIARN